ncbi:MAG: tetratricopeptide repeat protein [Candidatus Nitronauta litoralis]|uniref:Tetratricopeptide repeat protein n=1 Tax=Candidatus Nitronauta litoralis TaxID=2705533 RepID=A0A7T0BYF1_9BACT|nr:MAG: tetratricopeptide repeat protein [Candidatus Nitronauta litoralis]
MPKKIKVLWVLTSIVIVLGFFFTSIKFQVQQSREDHKRRAEESRIAYEEKLAKRKAAMALSKKVENIREMVASGKNKKAIILAKEVVEKDPENALARTWWAVALVNLKKMDEAIEMFKASSSKDPNQAKTYQFWGLTLVKMGRYQEAIDKYENALLLEPENSNGFTYWGAALGQMGRHKEAVEKLIKALDLNPFNKLAYGVLVDSYFHLGDYPKAWETVKNAKKQKLTIPEGTLSRLRKVSPEKG